MRLLALSLLLRRTVVVIIIDVVIIDVVIIDVVIISVVIIGVVFILITNIVHFIRYIHWPSYICIYQAVASCSLSYICITS